MSNSISPVTRFGETLKIGGEVSQITVITLCCKYNGKGSKKKKDEGRKLSQRDASQRKDHPFDCIPYINNYYSNEYPTEFRVRILVAQPHKKNLAIGIDMT